MALTAAQRELIVSIREQREGNALNAVAGDLDQLSRGVDASGNAMKGMEQDAKKLNAEIARTNLRIKDLHKQFAATGDESLFGDIRKEETRLRNLTKTLRALGTSGGSAFSEAFTSAFQGGFTSPAALAGITAGIAGLAIPLGAILAGAVVGTIGTGGVIGGVLAASHDPGVKGAFKALAQQAKDEFFGAGSSFVEPVLKSVGILATELHRVNLAGIFGAAAPDLEIIVKGLAGLVDHTLPGLNDLLARSQPFAEAAARGFVEIGDAFSEFFRDISQSHGAVEGLEALFDILAGSLKFLGLVLLGASGAFHFLNSTAAGTLHVLNDTLDVIGLHSDAIDHAAKATKGLAGDTADVAAQGVHYGDVLSATGGKLLHTADAEKALNDELKNTLDLIGQALGLSLSLDEANNNVARSFMDVGKAIADNGPAWNAHNEKALILHETIDRAIGSLQQMRDAEIKSGVGIQQANADYDEGVQRLLKLAGQAGATKAQLDALAHTYTIRFQIDAILGAIGNAAAQLKVPHFAAGGIMPGPAGSPGLAVLHGQERVLTPSQANAMDAGGGPVQVELTLQVGGNTDSAFATAFMGLVRTGQITIVSKAIV